jgi:hypothetical protein
MLQAVREGGAWQAGGNPTAFSRHRLGRGGEVTPTLFRCFLEKSILTV